MAGYLVEPGETVRVASDGVDVKKTASSTAESNTASNVNASGVGVFKQKTGFDLEFRGIDEGSARVSVTLDAGNNTIVIDIEPLGGASYGAPTGTATRTTFDTGSVTLPQLAERVKALIDDLS